MHSGKRIPRALDEKPRTKKTFRCLAKAKTSFRKDATFTCAASRELSTLKSLQAQIVGNSSHRFSVKHADKLKQIVNFQDQYRDLIVNTMKEILAEDLEPVAALLQGQSAADAEWPAKTSAALLAVSARLDTLKTHVPEIKTAPFLLSNTSRLQHPPSNL